MPNAIFRCPVTADVIETNLVFENREAFETVTFKNVRLDCPSCHTRHELQPSDLSLPR